MMSETLKNIQRWPGEQKAKCVLNCSCRKKNIQLLMQIQQLHGDLIEMENNIRDKKVVPLEATERMKTLGGIRVFEAARAGLTVEETARLVYNIMIDNSQE